MARQRRERHAAGYWCPKCVAGCALVSRASLERNLPAVSAEQNAASGGVRGRGLVAGSGRTSRTRGSERKRAAGARFSRTSYVTPARNGGVH